MRRMLPLLVAALVVAFGGSSAPGLVPCAGAPAAPMTSSGSAGAARAMLPVALFFGDSYFVGGGCSPDRTRDMAYLAANALGYRPVVRGGGGTGFVQANPDYGLPDYLGQIRAGALDVDHPQLVVIEGGTNDVGEPLDQIRRNANKVITAARSRHPDALLVLAGPMQTYGDLALTNPMNKALRRIAERRGIGYLDIQRWTRGHDDWLCSDYVHPTYAGHTTLGDMLADALARRGA